jgi:hypothetical protein
LRLIFAAASVALFQSRAVGLRESVGRYAAAKTLGRLLDIEFSTHHLSHAMCGNMRMPLALVQAGVVAGENSRFQGDAP